MTQHDNVLIAEQLGPEDQIELVDEHERNVSRWWKTSQMVSYFIVIVSGIATSVSVGHAFALYDPERNPECVLFANISLVNLPPEENRTDPFVLSDDNIKLHSPGKMNDCFLVTFGSASSAVFGAVWFALFFQCGKGGTNYRTVTQAWTIVPPAITFSLVFLVLACVIVARTTQGYATFCQGILHNGHEFSNSTTCTDVFKFIYPWDDAAIYPNYVLAQTGSALTFIGWLLAFAILLLRCVLHVDFVVMTRRPMSIPSRDIEGSSSFGNPSSDSDSSDNDDEVSQSPLLATASTKKKRT